MTDSPTRSKNFNFHSHLTLALGVDDKPMGFPLTLLGFQKTTNIMFLGRAESIRWSNTYIPRGERPPYRLPSVIRFPLTLHNRLAARSVGFTRKHLALRDEATCQYTGALLRWDDPDPYHRATLDHVIPVSQGGTTCWENCVLASAWANEQKGDLSLEDAAKKGIFLQRRPWVPTVSDMLSLSVGKWQIASHMPEAWKEFLEEIQPTVRIQRIREGKLYALAA